MDNFISIKGCFNYSLKNVARSRFNNRMIDTSWDKDSVCSNGLNAMYYALQYYNNKEDFDIMKSIINYNEIDCKVMYEILKYIRLKYYS